MRCLPLAALLVLLLAAPAAHGQCGTIDTTGATLTIGPSTMPGTVTVDPCAVGGSPPPIPDLGTLGTIGSMTGSLPTFPGAGTGADGEFHATADQALAGGTYDYTSYTVDTGVTVNYAGPVTIRATQYVQINGRVVSATSGSTITIRCGGDFLLIGSSGGKASVEAYGVGSHVDVLSNGVIVIRDRTELSSEMGNVSLVCLGTAGSGPSLVIDAGLVKAGGDLTIRSRYDLEIEISYVDADAGSLTVQSFEGRVRCFRSNSLTAGDGGQIVVEGQTVLLDESSYLEAGTSPIRVAAFGGDVRIEAEGPGPWGDARIRSVRGLVDLRAAGSVELGGGSSTRSNYGDITIRALGGDIVLQEEAMVGQTVDRDATVDLRARDGISATIPVHSSGNGHIRGGVLRLSSGDMDGRGACVLTSGKYRIRKVRGALIEPNLYLARVKGKIKGAGKDKLKLELGLATSGSTPAAAEDVRIRFGNELDVTIPAGSFVRSGDRWGFEGNVEGIRSVVLDCAREIVTVAGKDLDLGALAEGANAVYVGVDVGGDGRGVYLRMVRSGSSLRY